MLELIKIAITGGVASGKTTVCRFFKELGAYVVNADALVHELLVPETDLGQQVIQLLGPDILNNGKFCRSVIADKVFKSPKLLKELEHLLHPAVLKEIEDLYKTVKTSNRYSSFVVEIPLLFEIGAEKFYDVSIACVADEAIAKKRFGKTDREYDLRMQRQINPREKSARAEFTIYNNGSLEDLRQEVIKLDRNIKELFS